MRTLTAPGIKSLAVTAEPPSRAVRVPGTGATSARQCCADTRSASTASYEGKKSGSFS